MKRLLPISLLLAALCISTAAFAQKDKVVEASSKRKPAWIGSSDRSHFAVTEVGETLAAASGKCMASIRQYIVNAVAVNVSSAEKMATRQITRDQLVTAMSDYSSALMTEAGQLPYLNDITLSNAEAVYWERIYSKKTKTYRYEYSVLYPFPEQTRRQLIEAFVAIDDAKQAEYERLRRELGTITDIDRIRLAVNELDGLYDYFFDATRKGETLAAASGKCMASIRQYIVNAVAVNVSSAEKMATRQITRDQLVTAMSDYSSALMTEAGQLPYLNDITLSNAEAVYWERIYSKKTKTYRYEYSVLYPFPEQTRRQLIEAFVAIDDAKQAEYERLRRELGTITDIDRIRLAVNELDGLYDYFFDATRKGDVETLRRNYRALYNAVSIEVESEAPGECVYSLRLDGRPATTAVQPRLKSESVLEMAVKPYGDGRYLLSYDPQYASPTDINKIEVLYLFGGARVSQTIFFNPAGDAVSVRPKGTLRIEQSGGVIRGTMQLRVSGTAAEVRRIVLFNPADGARIVAERIEPPQLAGGDCSVTFEAQGSISPATDGVDVLRGSIGFGNSADGKASEADFTLHYKLTTK